MKYYLFDTVDAKVYILETTEEVRECVMNIFGENSELADLNTLWLIKGEDVTDLLAILDEL